jgi:predicted nucleic acid-binding protein
MRIVVSDSSCLIDLRKVSLLDALLRLPFEFLIPDTLFEDELVKFTAAQKKALLRGGLRVIELSGERVLRAQAVIREAPRLSVNDGFAFALAENHPGCILLSGDGELRDLATRHQMEVHGVLWVIHEIHRNQIETAQTLLAALKVFSADSTVRLPKRDVAAFVKRFSGLK